MLDFILTGDTTVEITGSDGEKAPAIPTPNFLEVQDVVLRVPKSPAETMWEGSITLVTRFPKLLDLRDGFGILFRNCDGPIIKCENCRIKRRSIPSLVTCTPEGRRTVRLEQVYDCDIVILRPFPPED